MLKSLEKPKLFLNKKEFIFFSLLMLLLLSVRLAVLYSSYETFIAKPFYYTYATVITSYNKTKKGKSYTVLKLRSDDGFTFYTTSHRRENFNDKRLRVQLFPNKSIGFKEYLGTFYLKSKIKQQEKLEDSFKMKLLNSVNVQHKEKKLASFFNAIFYASPLDGELRKKVSYLGVSHLVALSGFHLGILWILIYNLFLLFYRPLQQNYFPYRYALFDVGIVVIIVLGFYVWFVDAPASLVRSYAMLIVGWAALLLGLELLSFTLLSSVFLLLLVLFPTLLVSLSFWLSVAGVFYIFLLLKYTIDVTSWKITFVLLPLSIFILMLPLVHGIFGVTTPYQLLSPLLSLLFVPFYPLMMLLHIIGAGGVLDAPLLWLFNLADDSKEIFLPLWAVFIYLFLSLLAVWYKKVFYLILGLGFVYGVYIFVVAN